MANVTGELKELFSCENLKKECFDKGMKEYLVGLKKNIEKFLKQNKKMQSKSPIKSDTYYNLNSFTCILSGYEVSDDNGFNNICKAADLLPKYVLNTDGTKICSISFKASIKKVNKDIKKWVKELKSTNSKLEAISDLSTIKEAIGLAQNSNNGVRVINERRWRKISSNFKKSKMQKLKEIANQIDDNIIGANTAVLNWYENKDFESKTIENLINEIKKS